MYTLTLKMRALLVLLLFAMLMSLVTMPVPSFAQNTNYQEYLAYKEALGSPASLWIDPLAIDLPNGEKLVVYCYNKELDYPGAIELGGTPGYMHDHYPKIKADIQSKINNILYNGYPTNG